VGPDRMREEWARFVQDKIPERMSYAWFDTSEIGDDMKMMVKDLQQLLMMAAPETRQAEVTLLRDPDSSAPGAVLVSFSFPIMEVLEEQ